jgi:hypothetical protein
MRGYLDGQKSANERWERVNAVLTEQLLEARVLAQHQAARADAAVDHLMTKIGLEGISMESKRERAARAETVRQAIASAPQDPFLDLPIGHAEGSYKTQAEAELRFDDNGRE